MSARIMDIWFVGVDSLEAPLYPVQYHMSMMPELHVPNGSI